MPGNCARLLLAPWERGCLDSAVSLCSCCRVFLIPVQAPLLVPWVCPPLPTARALWAVCQSICGAENREMCRQPQNAETATKRTKQKVVWKRFNVSWPRFAVALGAAEGDSARSPLLQPVGMNLLCSPAPPAGCGPSCGSLGCSGTAPARVNTPAPLRREGALLGRQDKPPLVPGFLLECKGSIRIYPVREPVQRVYLGSKHQLA